jgi:hypothetical protein
MRLIGDAITCQIIPSSYSNVAKRIPIEGLPSNLVAPSPSVFAVPSINVTNGDGVTGGFVSEQLLPIRETPINHVVTTEDEEAT